MGLTEIFDITAQKMGLKILGYDSYAIDSTSQDDLINIATHIAEANPDLVYFGGGGVEAIPFLRELWAYNPHMQVMGADPFVVGIDDLTEAFGVQQLKVLYDTDLGTPISMLETEAGKAFYEKFMSISKSGEPPSFVAGAYETMNVLIHAIQQAKEPTRAGILTVMKNLGDYSGVFGTWHFNTAGDISKLTISGKQLQDNGEWLLIEIIK